jgi:long-chain acyl-CoA synthetase
VRHPWDQRLGVWWIAEDHPDQPAVVESPTGETLTFAELAGRCHQLVHALRANGLGVGDIVAFALPNGVDQLVWQLGLSEAGFRALPLNPQLSRDEVRGILDHADASVLVLHTQYAERLADLGEVHSLRLKVSAGGELPGFVTQEAVLDGQPSSVPDERVAGALMTYSSGTTGKPKSVWRDQVRADPSVLADGMKALGQAFQLEPFDGVHLVTAGMHHGGCLGFVLGALHMGQALAIHARFDAEQALAAIERHGVTTAYMVPTQFVRLLRLPEDVRRKYDVSSLKVVVHSAAPCSPDVKAQMFDWFGPVIWETYGGMEGAATIAKPHRWLEKPGTVGRAVRGVQVLILDDAGRELPSGEIGNVFIRTGERVEYKDDPDQSTAIHHGDAFTIGDVGYLDEDGYLFLCDRAKDMIISGGVNIYPAEIEGVLSAHPGVGDVAVIGVPDDEWGEQIRAIVELTPGARASDALADELIEFCRERLAKFKCPKVVEFRADLPRTESGKLLKRNLRDEYWATTGRSL